MDNSKKFPALQAAIGYLRDGIERRTWQLGETLPPIRTIALQTGISTPTICKALAALKKEKLISGAPHHRVHVGAPKIDRRPVESKLLQWEQKRIVLEGELLSGFVGGLGVLPSFKEIQGRYKISFKTIQKIVRSMVADGVIVPRGKGYALPSASARSARQKVVYVTTKNHESQRSALNQEHNRVIDAFETECVRRRLYFEIVEIDFYDIGAARKAIVRLTNELSTQGFILDAWWYTNRSVQQGYIDALTRLAAFKKPVAILDEIGTFELPIQFGRNPLLQVYRIESRRAGEKMARFLLEHGHRSVVFVSLFRDTSWSRDRYEGVVSQFSRAGYPDGVHAATETGDVAIANVLTVSGLSDADIRTFIRIGRTESQIADMERSWSDFKQAHHSPFPGFPRLSSGMRESLEGLIALARRGKEKFFFERTFAGALDAMVHWLLPVHLHPCLERALAFKDATAWICANDAFAIAAVGFLRGQGVRVPHDIAVVGFDNLPVLALEAGLTTFDFNTPGFIHRILNFVIRPPRPRGFYRHEPIEIEGIVMERDTTAKTRR